MTNKIIRTICLFKRMPNPKKDFVKLKGIERLLKAKGFEVQTLRICFHPGTPMKDYKYLIDEVGYGLMGLKEFNDKFQDYISNKGAVTIDLTDETITDDVADLLYKVIESKPDKTFEFNYGFNLPPSSPYFPSAYFKHEGISVGLQPTNLAKNCNSLEEWFDSMKSTWDEVLYVMSYYDEFIGIDSSIASLYSDESSFINFIKKLTGDFNKSTTTDTYAKITKFIKEQNPKPIGLCGLMLPCLEDFELAEEYEKGNFDIERNLFLSLQSGLGIDTYPIGVDESRKRVTEILKLVQRLSNKYKKPLSVRFVSDGKAKIGQKTKFNNKYLKDVVIRPI